MGSDRLRTALAAMMALAMVLVAYANTALADVLNAAEYRITNSPDDNLSPVLGQDALSSIVVYTSNPAGQPIYKQVFYQRIGASGPVGSPVTVSVGAASIPRVDISGDIIVYSTEVSQVDKTYDVNLYRISTGQTTTVATRHLVTEVSIDGNMIAWVEGLIGAERSVMLLDLGGVFNNGAITKISASFSPFAYRDLAVGGNLIVWRESTGNQDDVIAFDMRTSTLRNLTPGDQSFTSCAPSTYGSWVAWCDVYVIAQNVDTGERRVVRQAQSGSYGSPSIGGDLMGYLFYPGNAQSDLYVYRFSTNETFQVTKDPAIAQTEANTLGDLAAYVDRLSGNSDIFVSRLTFTKPVLPNLPPLITDCLDAFAVAGRQHRLACAAYDPNNDVVTTWRWTMLSKPQGSNPVYTSWVIASFMDFITDLPGDYQFSVEASDGKDWSKPAYVTIHVRQNQPPVASTGPDQTVFLGDGAVMVQGFGTDADGDPITAWRWTPLSLPANSNVAGSLRLDAQALDLIPDAAGDYVFAFEVSDGLDWSLPSNVTIHVMPPAVLAAVINADISTGPLPLTVRFDGTKSLDPRGAGLQYNWIIDGVTYHEPMPVVTFNSIIPFGGCNAPHTAYLTVSDGHTTSGMASFNVYPFYPLQLNAGADRNAFVYSNVVLEPFGTFDPTCPACGNKPYQFYTFAWTLDSAPPTFDGTNNFIPGESARLIPYLPGDYLATLVVTDETYHWCSPEAPVVSVTDSVLITVTLNNPPVAVITVDAVAGVAPLTVNFDAGSSTDPDSPMLAYKWDFGDQSSGALNTATGVLAQHVYNSPGQYTATLAVTDDYNNTDMASVVISGTAPNMPPVAAPTASPVNGSAPLDVQFTANATDPNPGDTLSYHWDFGDGNSSTQANPLHTYLSAGTRTATVTVSDGALSTSASLTITVSSPLSIKVTEAKADFGREGKVDGKITLKAVFSNAGVLSPGDVIKVVFDGLTVVEAPFGSFRVEGDEPGEYEYKEKNIVAKIDLNKNTIRVSRHKMVLSGVDNSNGVSVVIYFGTATGTDLITMEEKVEKGVERELKYKAR